MFSVVWLQKSRFWTKFANFEELKVETRLLTCDGNWNPMGWLNFFWALLCFFTFVKKDVDFGHFLLGKFPKSKGIFLKIVLRQKKKKSREAKVIFFRRTHIFAAFRELSCMHGNLQFLQPMAKVSRKKYCMKDFFFLILSFFVVVGDLYVAKVF